MTRTITFVYCGASFAARDTKRRSLALITRLPLRLLQEQMNQKSQEQINQSQEQISPKNRKKQSQTLKRRKQESKKRVGEK